MLGPIKKTLKIIKLQNPPSEKAQQREANLLLRHIRPADLDWFFFVPNLMQHLGTIPPLGPKKVRDVRRQIGFMEHHVTNPLGLEGNFQMNFEDDETDSSESSHGDESSNASTSDDENDAEPPQKRLRCADSPNLTAEHEKCIRFLEKRLKKILAEDPSVVTWAGQGFQHPASPYLPPVSKKHYAYGLLNTLGIHRNLYWTWVRPAQAPQAV